MEMVVTMKNKLNYKNYIIFLILAVVIISGILVYSVDDNDRIPFETVVNAVNTEIKSNFPDADPFPFYDIGFEDTIILANAEIKDNFPFAVNMANLLTNDTMHTFRLM